MKKSLSTSKVNAEKGKILSISNSLSLKPSSMRFSTPKLSVDLPKQIDRFSTKFQNLNTPPAYSDYYQLKNQVFSMQELGKENGIGAYMNRIGK